MSPWFLNAPCESGSDGLFLFKKIVKEAKNYLKPNGILLSPLLSLSNIDSARSFLKNILFEYKVLKRKDWFLPDQMTKNFKKRNRRSIEIR